MNIGGQLIQQTAVEKLQSNIVHQKVKSWNEVHAFYTEQSATYFTDKLNHAYTALLEILNITPKQFTAVFFNQLLENSVATREWMCKGIYESRAKDYRNPFRKMAYSNSKEMNQVVGRLEENSFIQEQMGQLEELKKQVKAVKRKLK